MAAPVTHEKVVYLLDPIGASRRSPLLRAADRCIRGLRGLLPFEHDALELPYIPPFLHKDGGLLLSIGQFNQWVGAQVMGTGTVQIWPGTPVAQPLIEDGARRRRPAHSTRAPTATASPAAASCRAWTSAPRSPSSATARSARSAGSSTSTSACRRATTSASGRSA